MIIYVSHYDSIICWRKEKNWGEKREDVCEQINMNAVKSRFRTWICGVEFISIYCVTLVYTLLN